MLVIDTNILIYAANRSSEFYEPCHNQLEQWRGEAVPVFLTWNICYEFLRVCTHPRILQAPWSTLEAWRFIDSLLVAPAVALLRPTDRHESILSQTLTELPELRGNVVHDVHTAVLMREHGVSRICTRDTDFHRFPFLTVIDPLREAGDR